MDDGPVGVLLPQANASTRSRTVPVH